MKKPHGIMVTPVQKFQALTNLSKRGVQIRRNADVAKIARAICAQRGMPIPELPQELGMLVIAFANDGIAGVDVDRTVLPAMKPYVPPRLPEWQQRSMDEFRAIPSLYA